MTVCRSLLSLAGAADGDDGAGLKSIVCGHSYDTRMSSPSEVANGSGLRLHAFTLRPSFVCFIGGNRGADESR